MHTFKVPYVTARPALELPAAADTPQEFSRVLSEYANFTGSIAYLNLHGRDLTDLVLPPNCDAMGASFEGSTLDGADMPSVRADYANLNATSVRHANLTGASLRVIQAHGADFTGAMIRRAVLAGANLTGAKFDHADACGAGDCGRCGWFACCSVGRWYNGWLECGRHYFGAGSDWRGCRRWYGCGRCYYRRCPGRCGCCVGIWWIPSREVVALVKLEV